MNKYPNENKTEQPKVDVIFTIPSYEIVEYGEHFAIKDIMNNEYVTSKNKVRKFTYYKQAESHLKKIR